MGETDSDEEAAGRSGVQRELRLPLGEREPRSASRRYSSSSTPWTVPSTVVNMINYLHSSSKALSSLPSTVPEVVPFTVGGTSFAVRRELLLKDPQSLLFTLAAEHYAGVPTTECGQTTKRKGGKRSREHVATDVGSAALKAITIPDRDPMLFRMLLNMLRGYANAIPPEWREACRAEVKFYGLHTSWEARFPSSGPYQFTFPPAGKRLSSELVCGVASRYFASGEHCIDFAIAQAERVAVGVIGEGIDFTTWDVLRQSTGCALYWNDGKVTSNFGVYRLAESGCPFPSPVVIRITLDANENLVRWMLNEDYCVFALRLPPSTAFAFIAVSSRNAQLGIVSPEAA